MEQQYLYASGALKTRKRCERGRSCTEWSCTTGANGSAAGNAPARLEPPEFGRGRALGQPKGSKTTGKGCGRSGGVRDGEAADHTVVDSKIRRKNKDEFTGRPSIWPLQRRHPSIARGCVLSSQAVPFRFFPCLSFPFLPPFVSPNASHHWYCRNPARSHDACSRMIDAQKKIGPPFLAFSCLPQTLSRVLAWCPTSTVCFPPS